MTRDGIIVCKVTGQLGDHLSSHRCQSCQAGVSGPVATYFKTRLAEVVRGALHKDTVSPSASNFMGISMVHITCTQLWHNTKQIEVENTSDILATSKMNRSEWD